MLPPIHNLSAFSILFFLFSVELQFPLSSAWCTERGWEIYHGYFNGFLRSSTTQIELIEENFLELQVFGLFFFFLLLKIFLSLDDFFFCKKMYLFFPSTPITKPSFLMFPHGQILAISRDNLVWSCVRLAFLL